MQICGRKSANHLFYERFPYRLFSSIDTRSPATARILYKHSSCFKCHLPEIAAQKFIGHRRLRLAHLRLSLASIGKEDIPTKNFFDSHLCGFGQSPTFSTAISGDPDFFPEASAKKSDTSFCSEPFHSDEWSPSSNPAGSFHLVLKSAQLSTKTLSQPLPTSFIGICHAP